MLHVVFHEPLIPPNTGNAIRMTAGVGARLHLVHPLGFVFTDAHLRRAGLDYHDLADVHQHESFDATVTSLRAAGCERIWAMTGKAPLSLPQVTFNDDDALLFGKETTGLPDDVLGHEAITEQVRIPMLPGVRSMNLSNSAAVATYEAWRQLRYPGSS